MDQQSSNKIHKSAHKIMDKPIPPTCQEATRPDRTITNPSSLKFTLLCIFNYPDFENTNTFKVAFVLFNSLNLTRAPRSQLQLSHFSRDLENERGVFSTVIFRNILEKLIYNDEYEKIDKKLTDSNVGNLSLIHI